MAQFILIIMGEDPNDVAASIGADAVGALKEEGVRIFEATHVLIAGGGTRTNLEDSISVVMTPTPDAPVEDTSEASLIEPSDLDE